MPGGGFWATAVQCRMTEADLYGPVKRFLEAQGYEVKGETGHRGVVGVRDGESPVVVELGERLTLTLVLQAVDRSSFSNAVYVAFRAADGVTGWRNRRKAILGLLRWAGLGLLTVSERDEVVPVLAAARDQQTPSFTVGAPGRR